MNKKNFLSLLAFVMVAMVSIGFNSCGNDDSNEDISAEREKELAKYRKEIVGKWTRVERKGIRGSGVESQETKRVQFDNNGNCTITDVIKDSEYSFSYEYKMEEVAGAIIVEILNGFITDSYVVSFENNYQTLFLIQSDFTEKYKRID